MKYKTLILAISALSSSVFAANNEELQQEIIRLQEQTKQLQTQLNRLQKQLVAQSVIKPAAKPSVKPVIAKPAAKKTPAVPATNTQAKASNQPGINKPVETEKAKTFHTSLLSVHTADKDHRARGFYPTALIADGRVISYIAGTPVVSSPYLGARPAFDGSDYIVNISSINRDIRLMEQRRRLYRAYESIGYPKPNMPIIAISGKAEPVAMINQPYVGRYAGDVNLGSSELDVAAALNDKVEAFISMAYDETPPPVGQRVSNSAFSLNMGFVNIGNLDRSPIYFTAGQMYVPFGRYSNSMISSTLPQRLARTKARPFILGYKSQQDWGPYAAIYGFKSDTNLGHSGIGGVNLGYTIRANKLSGDIGAGYISSITDSTGMQDNGSQPFTTFGGFASDTNGSELIRKRDAVNVHGNISFDRYSLTAEWVGVSRRFRFGDLSYNWRGAKPQAAQLEGALTFMAFNKPSSFALGYQWTKDSLALHLPKHRFSGVFNISIWKDTIESLEYRHDVDYNVYQFANGIAPPGLFNLPTFGTGRKADALIAQIGVFF
ncbi:coiled-coil protein [Legionella nautarum]|uniref:Coiled-coil protein n=1 Tax=Legionella nautarum TaxID=45070 RepID=A0A0W0X206_9GAMM|nr:LbtU family siderophore porin [Legionella nautarum]KTD38504.1 coiled-coil protein [Legionella nautarum]